MNLQIVVEALMRILTDILSFVPGLVNGLLVLLVGYLVAWLVRWLVGVVLRRLGTDALAERTGMVGGLRGLGLGARTIVYHILAGYYVRQRYRPGQG